jgi:hypothetical protein
MVRMGSALAVVMRGEGQLGPELLLNAPDLRVAMAMHYLNRRRNQYLARVIA